MASGARALTPSQAAHPSDACRLRLAPLLVGEGQTASSVAPANQRGATLPSPVRDLWSLGEGPGVRENSYVPPAPSRASSSSTTASASSLRNSATGVPSACPGGSVSGCHAPIAPVPS